MVPLPHLVEPAHQAHQVLLVRHLVVKHVVPPHPAGETEGDYERASLHPVGPDHLAIRAEHNSSACQALGLPATGAAHEMVLRARARYVLSTSVARCSEEHLDQRVHSHHVDEDLRGTVGPVTIEAHTLALLKGVVVHLHPCRRTHHYCCVRSFLPFASF